MNMEIYNWPMFISLVFIDIYQVSEQIWTRDMRLCDNNYWDVKKKP